MIEPEAMRPLTTRTLRNPKIASNGVVTVFMAMEPLVAVSSLIVFAGVLLFAFVIFSPKDSVATPTPQPLR